MTVVMEHYFDTHSDFTPGKKQARRAGAILAGWLNDVQGRLTAKVDDFSAAWQHAFIRYCASELGHAVGTISRNMKVINAAINHATKQIVMETDGEQRIVQLLKYAPKVVYSQDEVSRLTGKAESEPRAWLPTWEEMAEFIDSIGHKTAKGEWDKPSENLFRYVVVALNTWARPEAIVGLTVSTQVDFTSGIVRLNPPGRRQNKKYRPTIALTDNLRYWLEKWDSDRPIPVLTTKKMFRRHARKIGLPLFTRYTIRHFMATNVRRIDGITVDREQRKEWLGHKVQDTTSWYEHHDQEWLKEAREATDRIIMRLDGLLKRRTITSRVPPETAKSGKPALKLVSSK